MKSAIGCSVGCVLHDDTLMCRVTLIFMLRPQLVSGHSAVESASVIALEHGAGRVHVGLTCIEYSPFEGRASAFGSGLLAASTTGPVSLSC